MPIKNKYLFFLFALLSHFICAQYVTDENPADSVYIFPAQIKAVTYPKLGIPRLEDFKVGDSELILRKVRFQFEIPTFWEKKNNLSITASEVAFVNWNAGGNNSVSALAQLFFARNFKTKKKQWNNEIALKYGINAQQDEKLRKTDDEIRLASTFGYRKDTISSWYFSVKTHFRTQFSDGYKYPDRETPISRFMAPGYFFLGIGAEYSPIPHDLSIYISPLTQKTTFVLDDDLANRGAFGVKKAVFDAMGNLITPGKKSLTELGFLINSVWTKKLMKNVQLNNRINLYTDYLNSFGNIDIDWELNVLLTVNEYINAQIGTHLLFDDDVRFDEIKNDDGEVIFSTSKVQFKQLLGVGVQYSF